MPPIQYPKIPSLFGNNSDDDFIPDKKEDDDFIPDDNRSLLDRALESSSSFLQRHPYITKLTGIGVTGKGQLGMRPTPISDLGESFLPEAPPVMGRGIVGRALYENLVRPTFSPLGLFQLGAGAELTSPETLPVQRPRIPSPEVVSGNVPELPVQPTKPIVEQPKIPKIEEQTSKTEIRDLANQYRADLASGKIQKGLPFDEYVGMKRKESIEPSKARGEKGEIKIGADVESLGKVLGSSLYKGDIAAIATKELLQNSLDAVRHLDTEGQINVKFNRGENYIEVRDNGKGLTRQELETVFTNLGASGKRGEESAIGGFGLAKAAPLLGGERVEVTSVVNEGSKRLMYKFDGTPEELLKGVDIKSGITNELTGITVRTYVPKGSSFYDAKQFVEKLSKYSSGHNGNISLLDTYGDWDKKLPEQYRLAGEKGTTLAELSNPSADTKLVIPENEIRKERNFIRLQLSNNGMWQGEKAIYLPNKVPNLPENIIADIHSKVPEGHTDYPFTANREELRGTVENQVKKYIDDNLIKPSIEKRVGEIQQLYEGMPQSNIITKSGKELPFFSYDAGGRFTPEEMSNVINSPVMKNIASSIHDAIYDTLDKIGNEAWQKSIEKVGFLFDESDKGITYGVNIPNPKTGNHAILINPLAIIKRAAEPDQAASGISHIIFHEIAHEGARSEGAEFTAQLAKVYRDIGWRHENEINQSIFNAITDESGQYHPELSELLQRYTESRGRAETQADLLTGTGTGAKAFPEGPEEISFSRESNGEGAIRKLFAAIAEAKPLREQQENIYSMERARRLAMSESVKEGGESGFYKRLGKLRGSMENINVAGIRNALSQDDVDNLFDLIKNSPRITAFEKFRAGTGFAKFLEGQQVPQRSELVLLDKVFGNGFGDQIQNMYGGFGTVPMKLTMQTANTMKTLQSSIDFSAPFRQGLPLIHRIEYWKAFAEMFKYAESKEAFGAAQAALEKRPLFQFGRESGLHLSDIGSLAGREEAFLSSWLNSAEKIPILKTGYSWTIGASERAYVGFLNKLRADTFDSLVNNAVKLGRDPEEIGKEIARYVNVSTGRGSLGRLEKVAEELNVVLFSPRLISSRLTILNPMYYIKADPFIRREAIKSLLAITGAGMTTAGLAKLAGADVSLDSNSSDFLKARFGKTRLDPFGGFQQYIVAASRLMTGRETSSTTSKEFQLGEGLAPTRGELIYGMGNPYRQSFLEQKLSPVASLANTIMKGKDPQGNPINIPMEVLQRFEPMFMGDLIAIAQEDPDLLPLGALGIFGMGLQTYGDRPPKMPGLTLSPLRMQ